jgi:folate-binding protein YgfZ
MNDTNLLTYQAAYQQSAFFQLPESGFLRIAGEGRLDFLQRQTTNQVGDLGPGKTVLTVLTSATGRILDVLCLIHLAESIGAITLPGFGARTARFLRSRIFIMDKVTVEDASASFAQIDLLGPEAGAVLEHLGFASIPQAGEVVMVYIGQAEVSLIAMDHSIGLGYRLLIPAEVVQAAQDALHEAGAVALDEETYHILRVEAGLPGAGFELTEDYTPLETGLQGAVSTSKGCYTGQEVIARQINYDKVTQHLTGLKLSSPAEPGDRAWAEGKAVGTITSFALSPRWGAIALAVVKRPFQQPGTLLAVGQPLEETSSAQVVSLPRS